MFRLKINKGIAVVAASLAFSAQGSVAAVSAQATPQDEGSKAYSISVSSTESQQASANLTLSGENSKVSVEKKGSVTLVAGKSIVFHPGTRIAPGSFLNASINRKPGSHGKREARLVTVEENRKILEQQSLAIACSLFSPFPSPARRTLHSSHNGDGNFVSTVNDICGISSEQHRMAAVDSRLLVQRTNQQISSNVLTTPGTPVHRPETTRVLRL